ncbi:MAG: hypothetical protein HY300_07170 [Verrucomicrobia bacterium]|nr:hypothetical protein [Verrucomicrobiota bacterium]
MRDVAHGFIKPNDRLASFERLEIYNRQYWVRVMECLHEDYLGVHSCSANGASSDSRQVI